MSGPGSETRPPAWQADMLTTALPRLSSEMFTVNRVPNCAAVIRNLTFKYTSRLGLSSNVLVCSIIDSDLKFVSRIKPHWMNMLYVHFGGG